MPKPRASSSDYEAGYDHGCQDAELSEGSINHPVRMKHAKDCPGCREDARLARTTGWMDEHLSGDCPGCRTGLYAKASGQ